MNRMHPLIRAGVAIFAAFDCYLLVMAGMSWLEDGYGLHPMISFPLGGLFFIIAVYHALVGVFEMLERDDAAFRASEDYAEIMSHAAFPEKAMAESDYAEVMAWAAKARAERQERMQGYGRY